MTSVSASKIAEKEARIAKLKHQSDSSNDESEEEKVVKPKKSSTKTKTPPKKKVASDSESSSDDEDASAILARMRQKVAQLSSSDSDDDEPKPKPKSKKPTKKIFVPSDSESDDDEEDKKKKKSKKTKKKPKKPVSSDSSSESEPEPVVEEKKEPVKAESEKLKELMRQREQLLKDKIALASKSHSTSSATVDKMKLELEELRKRLELSSIDNKSVKKNLDEEREELRKREYGLDICFLMDCTGSMAPWLSQAKNHCRTIMTEAIRINEKVIPRIAFVGYRDFCDGEERLSIVNFKGMNEADTLKTHLDNCPAKGGGDAPEDVAGGLESVLKLDWVASTRLVIHIGDAPCHGNEYHASKFRDDYPKGDPNGLKPEDLLGRMCNKRIDYYFCKINNHTDVMMDIFNRVYTDHKKSFQVHNLGENPDKFLPTTIKSLTESMSRSAALSKH